MTEKMIAELREVVRLADKATPGPWVEDDNEGFSPWIVWERMAPSGNGKPGKMIARLTGDSCEYDANAHLIASAVNFLRARHSAIEADHAIAEVVWRFIDRMSDVCPPEDSAEVILADFVAAMKPHINAAIAQHSGREGL